MPNAPIGSLTEASLFSCVVHDIKSRSMLDLAKVKGTSIQVKSKVCQIVAEVLKWAHSSQLSETVRPQDPVPDS